MKKKADNNDKRGTTTRSISQSELIGEIIERAVSDPNFIARMKRSKRRRKPSPLDDTKEENVISLGPEDRHLFRL